MKSSVQYTEDVPMNTFYISNLLVAIVVAINSFFISFKYLSSKLPHCRLLGHTSIRIRALQIPKRKCNNIIIIIIHNHDDCPWCCYPDQSRQVTIYPYIHLSTFNSRTITSSCSSRCFSILLIHYSLYRSHTKPKAFISSSYCKIFGIFRVPKQKSRIAPSLFLLYGGRQIYMTRRTISFKTNLWWTQTERSEFIRMQQNKIPCKTCTLTDRPNNRRIDQTYKEFL